MSGPYQYASTSPQGASDPNIALYASRYIPGHPHLSQPQSHQDGLAFWYRPDNTDPIYDVNVNVFGREGVGAGTEHIKHRRTRSGCFTCRSRRVKCDETRPVCDRCKKGNRECEFPQPTSSKRTRRADHRSSQVHSVETEDDEIVKPGTIKEESKDEVTCDSATNRRPKLEGTRTQSTQSISRTQEHRQQSETSSTSKDKASSPSTDASSSLSGSHTPASSFSVIPPASTINARKVQWTKLKPDIQMYLEFHQRYITHYHYMSIFDPEDFFHSTLVDLAITYEPLLYAVVAFSAYHHTLRQPDGQTTKFLGYYSKSLSLLLRSLGKGAKYSESMILTILQLATFEEYLGDWVSLVGHHRAAHQMLLELYTLDTFMQHESSRMMFHWYGRFDVVAGLMAGNETILGREWYARCENWYEAQIDREDVDIENTVQWFVAANRLLAMDIAVLFSKLSKGFINIQDFLAENSVLEQRLQDLKERIKPINDGYYAVTEFPDRVPLTEEDIVDPYIPGGLFRGAFWPLNYVWVSWYGLWQMHQSHSAIILQQPAPNELEATSLEQCRIWEAIQRWPEAPSGCMIGAHASLAIASVFLQKDERHTMWARRKLAAVERSGYIFPPIFRKKMAKLWKIPEIEHWWLPNDEGYIPLLKDIRKLVEERVNSQRDRDKAGKGDDIRDIKGIFMKMNLAIDNMSPTSSSPSSTGSGGVVGMSPTSMIDAHIGATLAQNSVVEQEEKGTGQARNLSQMHGRKTLQPKSDDLMSGIWNE